MTTNKLRLVCVERGDSAEEKKRLRQEMKRRRSDNENRDVKEWLLTENCLTALNRIFGERTGAGTKRNVFVYLSYSSEAPTDLLIERLIEQGWTVYCPRVEGEEMTAVLYGEDFSLSAHRIREPIGERFDGELQAVIAPLLAVDRQGNRLGYGGGYYDRFLKKHSNAKRIGYAFDFQVVKSVPCEPHDEKMECIVTDKQVLYPLD